MTNRSMLDATIGGTLMNKIAKATYALLEELVLSIYQWSIERTRTRSVAEVLESNQIATLTKRLDMFERENINVVQTNFDCGNFLGEHGMTKCPLV